MLGSRLSGSELMTPGFSKWSLCILLFLATTLNYLDRQTLGILAPVIQRELAFDNEKLGWLFSVFYYTYTFAQFGIGPLLDRWNLRWAYGTAVLLWSGAAALTATVTGFWGLFFFRALLGVMESANWPAAMRIVALVLPPKERTLGNGIFTSGTSVGALIAPGLILGVAGLWGWRPAFVVVGSFGLLWFALWVPWTSRKEWSGVWKQPAAANQGAWPVYRRLLTSPQFWKVFCVAILVNPCLYFNLNWLPTYFVQERKLELGGELGWMLTLIYVGLDLGYLSCGAAVLALSKAGKTAKQARRIVFLAATLLLGMSAAVPLADTIGESAAVLAAVNFGAGMWIAMYLTMAQEVSPAHVSTAAGLLGGSGSLAGAFAMWAVGSVTRQTGSFLVPLTAVSAAAVLAALAGLAVTRETPAAIRV
jgi:ACS family hexuronate transporter-like MFS transporter